MLGLVTDGLTTESLVVLIICVLLFILSAMMFWSANERLLQREYVRHRRIAGKAFALAASLTLVFGFPHIFYLLGAMAAAALPVAFCLWILPTVWRGVRSPVSPE